MKNQIALAITLIALLVSQNCANAQVARHDADVCVYGGTASGVMAALAAEKEGAKVILIEPSRWLGGMTGGGINHLDWGKGSTVGGSTFKILMEGVKEQEQKHHGGHAIHGIGNRQYRERFKKLIEDRRSDSFEESCMFVIPIYLEGDDQARDAARDFVDSETRLRINWDQLQNRGTDGASYLNRLGRGEDLQSLPPHWAHRLIQSGKDEYLEKYRPKLPPDLADVADQFVLARKGMFKLSR